MQFSRCILAVSALPFHSSSFQSGGHLLSHTVTSAVPSAARALTIVFGVGTRVPPGRIAARSFPPLSSMLNGPYACSPAYASFPPLNVFLTAHTPLGLWTAIQPLLLPLRKEVIQPHLPIRLPCYDFTPVIRPAFDGSLLVRLGHRLRALLTPMV